MIQKILTRSWTRWANLYVFDFFCFCRICERLRKPQNVEGLTVWYKYSWDCADDIIFSIHQCFDFVFESCCLVFFKLWTWQFILFLSKVSSSRRINNSLQCFVMTQSQFSPELDPQRIWLTVYKHEMACTFVQIAETQMLNLKERSALSSRPGAAGYGLVSHAHVHVTWNFASVF